MESELWAIKHTARTQHTFCFSTFFSVISTLNSFKLLYTVTKIYNNYYFLPMTTLNYFPTMAKCTSPVPKKLGSCVKCK